MKLNKLIILFAFMLTFVACEKERVFVEFADLEKGAFARQIGSVTGSFNFLDIDNSGIAFEVEFYDENNGETVTEYNWKVAYAGTKNFKPLKSFPKSAFTKSADGLPGVKVTFSFKEVLAALGLTKAQIAGGSFFDLQGEIKTSKGQTFTSANTSSNLIAEPAFRMFIAYRGNIVCPSALAGTYTAVTTGTSTDDCCKAMPLTVTVTIVVKAGTSPGSYIISDLSTGLYFPWYQIYGITTDIVAGTRLNGVFTDACGTISGSFPDFWSDSTIKVTGVVQDAAKGIFTYNWQNSFGDKGSTVLTKK